MDRFARFGLTTGMAGGLVLAFGAALAAANTASPPSHKVTTTLFVATSLLRLVGGIGLLLGIGGLTARCAQPGGRLLFSGYLLATIGVVLNLGWMWSDLFVIDTIAKVAPAVIDGDAASLGTRLDTGFMVAWLANLGMALLAVGVARTRTVTRWSWIALLVCGLITLVPLPFDGEIYEIFIGVPFAIAMGLALRHTDPRTATPQQTHEVSA
jgi:hypothetical protein